MKEVKIIFLQAEKEDFSNLSTLLSQLQQTEYFFILVPPSVNVLSKEEVLTMLSAIRD